MATILSRPRPSAADMRRLAVEAKCTENTVRRWYAGGSQHHGTRYYLTMAAERLGLPLPAAGAGGLADGSVAAK